MANETPAVVDNTTIVALTPAEMVPAQAELVAWCDRKIRALSDEADEYELHQKLAVENGWKTSVVTASLNRTGRRITYYGKMKSALEAGYLLVPNMPIDVLAVRVDRAKQPEEHHQGDWGVRAKPQPGLPAGVGRYVDDQVLVRDESYREEQGGKMVTVPHFVSDDYDEVDFPVTAMKPIVLQAAARAMALKIFDQIGQVQNERSGDPILVGQLLDPRGDRRRATFFIAWWVDTRTL